MKKIIALFLTLAIGLGLIACGVPKNDEFEEALSEAIDFMQNAELPTLPAQQENPTVEETISEDTTPEETVEEETVAEETVTDETVTDETTSEKTTADDETVATEPVPEPIPEPTPEPIPEPTPVPAPTPNPTPSTGTTPPSATPSTDEKPTDDKHEHDYTYKTEKLITSCTDGGFIHRYCSCGKFLKLWQVASSHSLATKKVITPATHESEGLAEMYCLHCSYTTTEVTPKLDFAYLVDIEIVSATRVKPHYLKDGQELLTRLFGKNKMFQDGDSVVLKVNMSDGGTDFKVRGALGCTYTVEGNLVYVTFDSLYAFYTSEISFSARGKDGLTDYRSMYFDVVHDERYLGEANYAGSVLREYGERLGMRWIASGRDFVLYGNGGYTSEDESLSLTGCTIDGTDDRILVEGNPDWIDEVIWLLDQYVAMGFTKFSFHCSPYSFTTLAE